MSLITVINVVYMKGLKKGAQSQNYAESYKGTVSKRRVLPNITTCKYASILRPLQCRHKAFPPVLRADAVRHP